MSTSTSHRTDPLHRERHDPHCLVPEALAQLLVGSPWRRVAVVGDSIAAGTGDPVDGYLDASWADRLVAALRAGCGDVDHLNLGVPGLLAAEVREQQLDAALAFQPDLAVVSAGPNDMLRRTFDPAAVEGEVEAIVGTLAASGCLVVTFGLLDLSATSFVPDAMRAGLHDRIATLNRTTEAITRRHGGIHVDYFEHPAIDDSLFSADMIHPNRRGHACIVTQLVHALVRARRRTAAGQR
jgi:lysophospholipase L1-like esterase